MPACTIVEISDKDIEECRRIAKERNDPKQRHGVLDQRFSRRESSEEIHVVGALGELAVARSLGLPIQHYPERIAGDGGVSDQRLTDGRTLQVKSTSYLQREGLLFREYAKFKADLAVFVIVAADYHSCLIMGWATREQFYKEAQMIDLGYGPNPMLPLARLQPWQSLVDELGAINCGACSLPQLRYF